MLLIWSLTLYVFHTLVASSCKVLSGMTHIQLLKEIYLFPMLPSLILYIQARPNNIRHTVLKATNFVIYIGHRTHSHAHDCCCSQHWTVRVAQDSVTGKQWKRKMLSRFHHPVSQAAKQLVSSAVRKSTQAAPAVGPIKTGAKSQAVFDREDKFGAHNYHPLPVALSKGEGRGRCLTC